MKRGDEQIITSILLRHKDDPKKNQRVPIVAEKHGLAIHLGINCLETYCLSHIKSGGILHPQLFDSIEQATEAMNAFCKLKVDWTLEQEELMKTTTPDNIRKRIQRLRKKRF